MEARERCPYHLSSGSFSPRDQVMQDHLTDLPAELDRRITELDSIDDQGLGFTAACWGWLFVLGLIAPALLLAWGWPR